MLHHCHITITAISKEYDTDTGKRIVKPMTDGREDADDEHYKISFDDSDATEPWDEPWDGDHTIVRDTSAASSSHNPAAASSSHNPAATSSDKH